MVPWRSPPQPRAEDSLCPLRGDKWFRSRDERNAPHQREEHCQSRHRHDGPRATVVLLAHASRPEQPSCQTSEQKKAGFTVISRRAVHDRGTEPGGSPRGPWANRLSPAARGCMIPGVRPTTRWPEARAQRGLIATPHALASEAGLAVFRSGGNALDAAIAAAITIAVVYPHMNSVGGDSFWLIYDARFADGVADEIKRSFWPIYHPDRLASGVFIQPELATTLEAIATDGADAFYRGDLARRIAAGASAAGSPLSARDLAEHRADW